MSIQIGAFHRSLHRVTWKVRYPPSAWQHPFFCSKQHVHARLGIPWTETSWFESGRHNGRFLKGSARSNHLWKQRVAGTVADKGRPSPWEIRKNGETAEEKIGVWRLPCCEQGLLLIWGFHSTVRQDTAAFSQKTFGADEKMDLVCGSRQIRLKCWIHLHGILLAAFPGCTPEPQEICKVKESKHAGWAQSEPYVSETTLNFAVCGRCSLCLVKPYLHWLRIYIYIYVCIN